MCSSTYRSSRDLIVSELRAKYVTNPITSPFSRPSAFNSISPPEMRPAQAIPFTDVNVLHPSSPAITALHPSDPIEFPLVHMRGKNKFLKDQCRFQQEKSTFSFAPKVQRLQSGHATGQETSRRCQSEAGLVTKARKVELS